MRRKFVEAALVTGLLLSGCSGDNGEYNGEYSGELGTSEDVPEFGANGDYTPSTLEELHQIAYFNTGLRYVDPDGLTGRDQVEMRLIDDSDSHDGLNPLALLANVALIDDEGVVTQDEAREHAEHAIITARNMRGLTPFETGRYILENIDSFVSDEEPITPSVARDYVEDNLARRAPGRMERNLGYFHGTNSKLPSDLAAAAVIADTLDTIDLFDDDGLVRRVESRDEIEGIVVDYVAAMRTAGSPEDAQRTVVNLIDNEGIVQRSEVAGVLFDQ